VEQFESLAIVGAAPGQESVSVNDLPRPVGDFQERALAASHPYDSYNCSPDNMRLTVNAIPNSVALRARWVGGAQRTPRLSHAARAHLS
jgi:protein transport protein SEC24